jgi:5-methylcytosine-specific restriction protein A
MIEYVAYHSSELMGEKYQPTDNFHFWSRKPEKFLRNAIGRRVWVITSTSVRRHTDYKLAGAFTPSDVRREENGYGITGSGTPFRPPVEVTLLPWFKALIREQNNFSYGFNQIRSKSIVARLQEVLDAAMNPEQFSTDDYLRAFDAIRDDISNLQLQMLLAHYSAPDHSVTARQLAAAVGLANFNAANLHYGKLGRLLFSVLGKPAGADNVFILADLVPPGERGNKEWLWVMRPQVAQTLQVLGFVPLKSTKELPSAVRLAEGAANRVVVNVYERNPLARQQCIQHFGCRCSVCGFDFEKVFGELGHGFIHVHHLKPLSQIKVEYEVDPITDLRPICPNCHAMIHNGAKMMRIQDLKKVIRAQLSR